MAIGTQKKTISNRSDTQIETCKIHFPLPKQRLYRVLTSPSSVEVGEDSDEHQRRHGDGITALLKHDPIVLHNLQPGREMEQLVCVMEAYLPGPLPQCLHSTHSLGLGYQVTRRLSSLLFREGRKNEFGQLPVYFLF